jgi:hypothetical protein
VAERDLTGSTKGAALAMPVGPTVLALAPAGAVDEPVASEEHPAAGEDAEIDRSICGRRVGCLLDEIESDGADQDARAEGCDQPDPAHADAKDDREDGADDERADAASVPQPNDAHI